MTAAIGTVPRCRRPPSVAGFGLLEAIVALAILAGTGAALFAWISQNLQAAARIEAAQARVALQLTAQGLLASVNPFTEPEGSRRLGATSVSWRAKLVAPLRASVPTQAMEQMRWRVGLYELTVTAKDENTAASIEFTLMQAGLEALGAATSRADPP